jgi:hypothetical protein
MTAPTKTADTKMPNKNERDRLVKLMKHMEGAVEKARILNLYLAANKRDDRFLNRMAMALGAIETVIVQLDKLKKVQEAITS